MLVRFSEINAILNLQTFLLLWIWIPVLGYLTIILEKSDISGHFSFLNGKYFQRKRSHKTLRIHTPATTLAEDCISCFCWPCQSAELPIKSIENILVQHGIFHNLLFVLLCLTLITIFASFLLHVKSTIYASKNVIFREIVDVHENFEEICLEILMSDLTRLTSWR